MSNALRELLLEFGISVDDRGLKKADRSILGVVRAAADGFNEVTEAAGKIIGVVSDVARFVSETIEAGGAMADAAAAAGMTTEAYQRLGFIAGLAGVETDALRQAVIRLQRSAIQASRGGSSELGRVYRQLGVNVRDSTGQFKDGVTLFREVGLALNNVTSQTERAALAQEVFGRSGAQLLPIFAGGEEGIARIEARFRELGGGMSGEFVAAADAADDAMSELSLAWTGLRSELVVALIPAIRDVTTFLADAIAWLVRLTRTSAIVEAGLIGIGVALAAIGALLAPVVIPGFLVLGAIVGAIVLPLAALVLLVDDLITFFRGGKSVIGRFLDSLFGVGTSKTVLMQVRQAVDDIVVAFEVARMVAVGTWHTIAAGARGLASSAGAAFDDLVGRIRFAAEQTWAFYHTAFSLIGIDINGLSTAFDVVLAAVRQTISSFVAWAQQQFSFLTGAWVDIIRAASGVDVTAAVAQVRATRAAGQTTAPAGPAAARPAAVTAPRQRGRGGARINAPVNVTVHAGNADARQTAALVERTVDRRLQRTLRDAVASLEPQAPRPAP